MATTATTATRVGRCKNRILYSRIRKDEKLLLGELRDRGHEVEKIDVRKERFGLESTTANVEDLDIVVDRCLSTSRSLYATKFLDSYGVPVVNSPKRATSAPTRRRTRSRSPRRIFPPRRRRSRSRRRPRWSRSRSSATPARSSPSSARGAG